MKSRLLLSVTALCLSFCATLPVAAVSREIKCSTNVLLCLKKAFKRCPKNVTFIGDRKSKAGFRVLPRGTPLTEENIRNRPTYTVCTPK